jgi:tetratricopeptide (TPR) repeat protein
LLKQAGQMFREALSTQEGLVADFPGVPRYHFELAKTRKSFGHVLARSGEVKQAEEAFRQAVSLENRLALEFPKTLVYRGEAAITHCFVARLLIRQGLLPQAAVEYRLAVKALLAPGQTQIYSDRDTLNEVAWFFATCPDHNLHDGAFALDLAKNVVKYQHSPQIRAYWNTLGVAQYRAENWKAAVAALEKSMQLQKGGNSDDWFFVAMAHWQLNEKKKARAWYDKAVQWMDMHQPKNEELRRFRAEAAALLGIKEPPRQKGKEVSPRNK